MRYVLICLICLAPPLRAQDTDLELVLLADASGSIDQREIEFQRQGYAQWWIHTLRAEARAELFRREQEARYGY